MATYPLAIRVNPRFYDVSGGLNTDGESKIWRRRYTFKDFNAATTTTNFDLQFPGGVIIERGYISLITVFSGGAAATATFSLGTTGSPATYLAATNVFTGATAAGNVTVATAAGLNNPLAGVATPTAVGTVRAQLITTVGNTNVLTQGVVDVYLTLRALSFKTT
jgi:hypothetical protein